MSASAVASPFITNMTPEMVRHSSAMVGYRTYPRHGQTGGRAAGFSTGC